MTIRQTAEILCSRIMPISGGADEVEEVMRATAKPLISALRQCATYGYGTIGDCWCSKEFGQANPSIGVHDKGCEIVQAAIREWEPV